MPDALPIADLEHVLSHTGSHWESLRGKRLFITGGTGFFGRWLLESFALANDRLGLGATVLALTRDPAAFAKKAPPLANRRDIEFLQGDVRDFRFPSGRFDAVIHAATEASAKLNEENPLVMLDTIVAGTRRALDFAVHAGSKCFLLTSSGAVYGPQPPTVERVSEDFAGAPDPSAPNAAYGEAKRMGELLCHVYARKHGLDVKIARCFAFVGPGLPLDAHFAIGNFIRDALAGGPIVINGDGTPIRSYLYAADLAVWLWKILFAGANGRPYNVGSARLVSIAETAQAVVRALNGKNPIVIVQKPVAARAPSCYAPDASRARSELDLGEWIDLEEGVRRTAQWRQEKD